MKTTDKFIPDVRWREVMLAARTVNSQSWL